MDFSVFLQLFNFFQAVSPGSDDAIDPPANFSVKQNSTLQHEGRTTTSFRQSVFEEDGESGVDCRGVFGCFPNSAPWVGPERPVNLPPESLEEIKPIFCLHSFEHPKCHKIYVDKDFDLQDLDVSSDSYVIFVTHGFMRSTKTPWVRKMVSVLIKNFGKHLRVFTLNWKNGATPPYAQAVANTRIMGAVAGRLLEVLVKEKGVDLSRTHLVGHSLGAHLFGYSGNYVTRKLGKKVGRITGMDPAGPFFRRTVAKVHLDHTDAFLVDIFHTDSTALIPTLPVSLGHPEPTGHLDFFPNGGGKQKSCGKLPQAQIIAEKGLGEGVMEFFSCNHEMSHRYLTTSVSKRCNYIGVECSSWEEYKEGKCWDCNKYRCFRMGFNIARVYPDTQPKQGTSSKKDFYHVVADGESKIKLFMATTSNENLCGKQVRFSLVMSDEEHARSQGNEIVMFDVVLRGQNGSTQTKPRERGILLSPGETLQWVDAVPSGIGEVHTIVITWQGERGLLRPLSLFRFTPPTVHPNKIVVEKLLSKSKKIFVFCSEKLAVGETAIFKKNCNRGK